MRDSVLRVVLLRGSATHWARRKLLNRSFFQQPYVLEPVQADLLEMFETISLLLSTLNFPIYDSLIPQFDAQLMYCSTGSANASGEKVADGFVVFRVPPLGKS